MVHPREKEPQTRPALDRWKERDRRAGGGHCRKDLADLSTGGFNWFQHVLN